MMDLLDINKLYLFILFVIPGFITLKVFNLISSNTEDNNSKDLIEAVSYSCINYAILFIPLILIQNNKDRIYVGFYFLFYFFALFVFPILIAFFWNKIRTTSKFQDNMPHPTKKPWDYVFSKRECYWLIIELKNGEKIAGKYADKSFTSSYPEMEQIYLEEAWVLNDDGGFERKRNRSAGIMVVSDEISTIEFFHMEE